VTPERAADIERICQAALEHDVAARDAFLEKACAGDAALRWEVESLLAQEPAAAGFMSTPAVGLAGALMAGDSASWIGRQLGPYVLHDRLGVGGMGEVYQAHDTKLDRDVAIKVLPEAFAHDPDRLTRFQREAKMLAALNHPTIATIHGLELSDGTSYLVMELVPGETLQQRLARKSRLTIEDALGICRQIAEALEAAHDKGIIHRDLKPANVKVTPEGKVKVLDFGLAKAFVGDGTTDDPTHSPTLSIAATAQGVILGTAAYMSPEQARGQAVDKRTDMWAFGCVLYEFLTGKQAFHGDTVTEILAGVLKGEPDWSALPAATPTKVRDLLRRCLQKDKTLRMRDAGDASIEIQEALATPTLGPTGPRLPWSVAGIIAICAAVAVVAALWLRRAPIDTRVYRSTWVSSPDLGGSAGSRLALSPDGANLAFVARDAAGHEALWVRPLESLLARPLPGTDNASAPFWSPDSRFLAFFTQGKLSKIDVSGGPVIPICECSSVLGYNLPGTWSRDDVILFTCPVGPILRVPAAGGIPTAVTTLDEKVEIGHVLPSFLPDGRHFVYSVLSAGVVTPSGVYVGSMDSTNRTRVLEPARATSARYAQGRLLFLRATTLFAQAFDAQHLAVLGEPIQIVEQVRLDPLVPGAGAYTVSETGVLAYEAAGIPPTSRLVWVDRRGKRLGVVGNPLRYSTVNLSSDGSRASFTVTESDQVNDVWVVDVRTGRPNRITFDRVGSVNGVWSHDGTRIVYDSLRNGQVGIYQKASTGAGTESLVYADETAKGPISWSPDNRYLLFTTYTPATSVDQWILRLTGKPEASPFLQTAVAEGRGQFSPNGQWIAYSAGAEGRPRNEVYVVAFPGGGGKQQVSTTGGDYPRWSHDGKELFFIGQDDKLTAASVSTEGGRVEIGAMTPLFDLPGPLSLYGWDYDVSPDGRFLVIAKEQAASAPINLVVNWIAALRQ
jgi:serine/threonine protein kinase